MLEIHLLTLVGSEVIHHPLREVGSFRGGAGELQDTSID
jgi:hypothetical protein